MEYASKWESDLVHPKHQALHNPADIDPLETDIVWQTVEQEMFQLMRDRMGLGLAAPQLGNPVKMFVMSHSTLGNIAVYNPKILFQSEETTSLEEGSKNELRSITPPVCAIASIINTPGIIG